MGRHIGYVVVLEEPINDEYSIEYVVNALKQIKGVIDVKPVEHNIDALMAESKVKNDVAMRLYKLIEEFRK